jgi:hypothetical protein
MMLKGDDRGLLLTALGHERAEVMSPVAPEHDRSPSISALVAFEVANRVGDSREPVDEERPPP